MFEYLMPPLFLRAYPVHCWKTAPWEQSSTKSLIGKAKGVPWVSPKPAFTGLTPIKITNTARLGYPDWALSAALGDDLVIAPYASLMAIR